MFDIKWKLKNKNRFAFKFKGMCYNGFWGFVSFKKQAIGNGVLNCKQPKIFSMKSAASKSYLFVVSVVSRGSKQQAML